MSSSWVHGGFKAFSEGRFENGGANIYVNARGEIEMINRLDINHDGYVDIILANSHGYIERGPTWIYKPSFRDGAPLEGSEWPRQELPNDSGWISRIVDLDGDGHDDLVVVNGENGVTSELDSYVYWGGPGGLSGERIELPTIGAYEVAVLDLTGSGLMDLVFSSAWVDHHNRGRPILLKVYEQVAPRQFVDASERFGLNGVAATSVVAADLNGNGRLDLVVANYRQEYEYDTDSFIYWATEDGFETEPQRLPTHYAMQVMAADLNGDGSPELFFAGGDEVHIFWNDSGYFRGDNCTRIGTVGFTTMFCIGAVRVEVADVDGDGQRELIIATEKGLEIRRADNLQQAQMLLPLPYATWVQAVDLDGDGRLDLIASKYDDRITYETESAVFWNGPNGLQPERVSRLPTAGAMGCSAGDLDGDGQLEIVFNNTMSGPSQFWKELPCYVYLGGPDADYGTHRRLDFPVEFGSSGYILADLDLDGYHDLVLSSGNGIRIFPGGPDGPRPDNYADLAPEIAGYLSKIHVADFNRDGYLDLLLTAGTYDDKPETVARSSLILLGSADGFDVANIQRIPTYGTSMHIADVDGDGYLDILATDQRGYIAIHYGGPDGYSPDRVGRIHLEGAIGTINSADLNGNGYLDLVVGYGSHYYRTDETFLILYGSKDGYSIEDSQRYDGGYTPGYIGIADYDRDGDLDLLVSAYSTDLTRELPARLFRGKGGLVDLEHPFDIHMNSAHQIIPIDLNRNGYCDLVVICHRNDLGHQVDSMIVWNGPEGLDVEGGTPIPGLGPHAVNDRDPGNAYTREPCEFYISPPYDITGRRPTHLHWDADVPETTGLKFQVRWARNPEALLAAPWFGSDGEGSYIEAPGESLPTPPDQARWLQYRTVFISLYQLTSPRLREVTVEFE